MQLHRRAHMSNALASRASRNDIDVAVPTDHATNFMECAKRVIPLRNRVITSESSDFVHGVPHGVLATSCAGHSPSGSCSSSRVNNTYDSDDDVPRHRVGSKRAQDASMTIENFLRLHKKGSHFLSRDGKVFMCLALLKREHGDMTLTDMCLLGGLPTVIDPSVVTDMVTSKCVPSYYAALHPANIGLMFRSTNGPTCSWLAVGKVLTRDVAIGSARLLGIASKYNLRRSLWKFVQKYGDYKFPEHGWLTQNDAYVKKPQGGGFHGIHGIGRRLVRTLMQTVVLYMQEIVEMRHKGTRRPILSLREGPGAMMQDVQYLLCSYAASSMRAYSRRDIHGATHTGLMSLTVRGRAPPGTRDVTGAAAILGMAAEVLSDEEDDKIELEARRPSWMCDGSFVTHDPYWRLVRDERTGEHYYLMDGVYHRARLSDAAAASGLDVLDATAEQLTLEDDTRTDTSVEIDGSITFHTEEAFAAMCAGYEQMMSRFASTERLGSQRVGSGARASARGRPQTAGASRRAARTVEVASSLPTTHRTNVLLLEDGTVIARPRGRPRGQTKTHTLERQAMARQAAMKEAERCAALAKAHATARAPMSSTDVSAVQDMLCDGGYASDMDDQLDSASVQPEKFFHDNESVAGVDEDDDVSLKHEQLDLSQAAGLRHVDDVLNSAAGKPWGCDFMQFREHAEHRDLDAMSWGADSVQGFLLPKKCEPSQQGTPLLPSVVNAVVTNDAPDTLTNSAQVLYETTKYLRSALPSMS
jgi:hypothetical protein